MPNNYKNILDNIEWSFSTLKLYEDCPYAFYNKKICMNDSYGNAYAEIGKYGHEINEAIFNKKMTVDEALCEWIDHFEDNVHSYVRESTKEKKYIEYIDYLSEFDEERLRKFDILSVEKKMQWRIKRKKFVGFADLILRSKETGEIYLVDHKSAPHFLKRNGEVLKNQVDNFFSYSKQMYLYCKPIHDEFGTFPSRLIWNHMFEQKITCIPFVKDDYEAAQEWALQIIQSIYKDKYFKEKQDYMMCKVLCDWRNICEYNLERGE